MQLSRFLTSRVGRNGKDKVVMGDLYKHDRLMQASWNVVDMFVKCMFFFFVEGEEWLFGHLCSRCHHVGQASTGEACPASGATSSPSSSTVKIKHIDAARDPLDEVLSTPRKCFQLRSKIKSCGDGVV